MGCRCLRRLRRFRHGAVQGVQLGLALDVVQRDLWAAAGPALERATVERRLVAFRRPHEAERNGAAVPVRTYRQQGQAAAAAGDRTRCVSRDLDHVGQANHRAASGPQTMAQRLPAKSPVSMAGISPKPQDVETPMSLGGLRRGAPRPMKMGTIASPWRYDAALCSATRPPRLRPCPQAISASPWDCARSRATDARAGASGVLPCCSQSRKVVMGRWNA